jgi:uncharacterized protein YjbJ (UPF0337 family)
MQELLNKLMHEVGITPEQASKALNTVVGHVKGLLPDSFGATIDNMLADKPAEEGATPQAGIMGKAADMAGDAKEKLGDIADSAKEKLGDAKEKLGDIADSAKEKFAAFTSEENIDALKDKAEDLKDKAEDMAEDAINKLKGFFGGKKED